MPLPETPAEAVLYVAVVVGLALVLLLLFRGLCSVPTLGGLAAC
jgi:hypothetical protein